MPFDLADVVPLSVSITDADGAAANAGTVTCTVYLPDGTSDTPAVTNSATGVYDADYVTVQAGRHGVRWVATSPNAAAFTDAFDVEPTDPDAFVSLADVLAFLQKTGDTDDLTDWVRGACRMIRDRIGHVSPLSFTEDFPGAWDSAVLRERPILEITSVERLPGLATIAAYDPATGAAGWVQSASTSQLITHSTGYLGPVRVAYRVGRSPVPNNVRLAGLELAGHLWRSSQLNGGVNRPPLSSDDMPVMPGAAYALPIRVRELLGIGRDMFGDEVLVA